MEVLYAQGAEARLYSTTFQGRPCLKKERFKKAYREAKLDAKLTQKRLVQEVRTMARCRLLGIRTPTVYHVDMTTNTIYMEHLTNSIPLKQFIDQCMSEKNSSLAADICFDVGYTLAILHNANVIHGDLTTSNVLLNTKQEIILIDFGLSTTSALHEDKGVDLYVLEKAFLSTHIDCEELFQQMLKGYGTMCNDSVMVIRKLDEIRLRGRKRSMMG